MLSYNWPFESKQAQKNEFDIPAFVGALVESSNQDKTLFNHLIIFLWSHFVFLVRLRPQTSQCTSEKMCEQWKNGPSLSSDVNQLTPAPQSPRRCCPWGWRCCWESCRTRTTWPAGGSAGSGANAGGYCPASTDTGSSSGRSMRLVIAWTEFRFNLSATYLKRAQSYCDGTKSSLCA